MAQITLQGNPAQTIGELPERGVKAPDFLLTRTDLSDVRLGDFAGKRLVLNIFPSIDTPVCATSVRRFNSEAAGTQNTVVLCISADLPFAHKRFCEIEGLERVVPLSVFRNPEFGKEYGVTIKSGPLAGLLARAVVVIDTKGIVVYSELVAEIGSDPNFEAALQAVAALAG